jgi:hypothetical protein
VLLRPAAVLPPMGKRRKRRHAAVVVEELDEDELQHRQPPHQEERKKKRRVAAVPSPASPPLGAAPPVQRQAAQFLAQLAPGLGCSLGACRVEGASCSAHRGPAHEPCTSCGHAATLHELELGRRSKQLVGLGGAAWLLLRARAAIVQLGSFAWCDALVRAAQAAAPQALGMSESEMLLDAAHNGDFSALQRMLDGGGGGGGGESAAQQPSPREVVRWWRHHSAAGGSGHVSDGEDMECVVRLACEIDALWFRLHYHTATESPMELAGSSTSNAHGVPTHGEWVARAVGATLDSSLLGGSAKQRRVIAAQVGALGRGYPHEAGRAGRSTDIDGVELAAMLRRGLDAAKLGSQGTLRSWCSCSPHDPSTSGSGSSSSFDLENELKEVYCCLLLESQLLFQHNKMVAARLTQQWSLLAGAPQPPPSQQQQDTGSTAVSCVMCAKQHSQNAAASACCSFCGSWACIDTCAAECLSCGETICLRCRYQDEVCPRCDFPLCPPLLSLYRDSCRDPACHLMAYAVPSDTALDAIKGLKLPVIECGAGTGYWAKMLRARGVIVAAYDIAPAKTPEELLALRHAGAGGAAVHAEASPPTAVGNEYHAEIPAFTTVLQGGAEAAAGLAIAATAARSTGGTDTGAGGGGLGFDPSAAALFMCFPPPVSRMASDCLRAYRGSVFVYVGEWQGETGTPKFEKRLCKEWLLRRRIPLPNWGSTSYTLTIWLRRSHAEEMAAMQSKAKKQQQQKKKKKKKQNKQEKQQKQEEKTTACISIPDTLLLDLDVDAVAKSGKADADRSDSDSGVGEHNGTTTLSPMPCAACGRPAKRRCRFCHAVAYCSAHCAAADAPAHRRCHRVRGVFLTPRSINATTATQAGQERLLNDDDGGDADDKEECGEGAFRSKQHYGRLESFVQRG